VSTEVYAIKIQQTGAEKVAKAYDGMAQAAERTNRKVKEVAETSKKSVNIMGQFRSALVALSAVRAATGLIDTVDAAQRMSNQMKVSTKSVGEYNQAMAFLKKISMETRTDIESNAQVYARLLRSTQGLDLSTQDLERTMEGLALAVKVGGATSMEAKNSLIQFSQSLASGALRGDELRSVAEQLPALASAIGKEFGMSGGQLIAFAKANPGILETKEVVEGVMKGVGKLREEFGLMTPTIGEGFIAMKTGFLTFLTDLEASTGILSKIALGFIYIGQSMATIIPLTLAFGAAVATVGLTKFAADILMANNLLIRYVTTGRLVIAVQTLMNALFMKSPFAFFVTIAFVVIGALVLLYQKSEAFRIAIDKVFTALGIVANMLGVVLGHITAAIGGWAGWQSVVEAVGYAIGGLLYIALTGLITLIAGVMVVVNLFVQGMAALGWVSANTATRIDQATNNILVATGGLYKMGFATEEVAGKTNEAGTATVNWRDQINEITGKIMGNTDAVLKNGKAVDELGEKSARMIGHTEGFGVSMRSLSSEIEQTTASMWDSTAAGQKLRDSLLSTGDSADSASDSIGSVNDGLGTFLGIDGEVYNGLNGVASGYRNVASAASAAASATRAANNAVSSGGGGGTSGGNSTGLASIASVRNNINKPMNYYSQSEGKVVSGARASGGPVTGGKTYLVGEKGPELFTPESSGSVASNSEYEKVLAKYAQMEADMKAQRDYVNRHLIANGVLVGRAASINMMQNMALNRQFQQLNASKADALAAAKAKDNERIRKELKRGFADDGAINLPGFENVGPAPKIDFQTLTPWQTNGGGVSAPSSSSGYSGGGSAGNYGGSGGSSTVDNSIHVTMNINTPDAGSFRQNQAQIEGNMLAMVERAQRRKKRN
jgi:tape measure domain-containing protein